MKGYVYWVAKENFPEDHNRLTVAVIRALKNGELDKDLKEIEKMSPETQTRYLVKTMKNFHEKEQQHLTEAVMNAFKSGELDEGLTKEEQQRYLLTRMQQMQEDWTRLEDAALRVARRNFPPKDFYRLTGTVMEAFQRRELDKDWYEIAKMPQEILEKYLFRTMQRLRELPVAASAVKFCSNLFREANSKAWKSVMAEEESKYRLPQLKSMTMGFKEQKIAKQAARQEAEKAAKICHKVLTGELGADDGPEWAEKAAKSSQPNGQHLELGRLEKVNATEKAGKVSVDNVCKDECIELVKEMRKETVKRMLAGISFRHPMRRFVPSKWSKRWKPKYSAVVRIVVDGTAELAFCGRSSAAQRKASGRPSAARSSAF